MGDSAAGLQNVLEDARAALERIHAGSVYAVLRACPETLAPPPCATVLPPPEVPEPVAAAAVAPPLRPDLEALDIRCFGAWSLEQLDRLSVAELYAVGFDLGEHDPAESLMQSVADEIVVLECAARAESPPREWILRRFASRLSTRARVAAELHRRQRTALEAARLAAGG